MQWVTDEKIEPRNAIKINLPSLATKNKKPV